MRRIFIRDLRLEAEVGVYAHERGRRQPIVVNIELEVRETPEPPRRLADVVDYSAIVDRVKSVVAENHIDLVEILAERVIEACLEDLRVLRAKVRVDKPGAIPDAASAGVEIERGRTARPAGND